ncbi:MAG TPA: aminotransferase class III-fold pyridoxal phosphate-dependent enzyme, partial [Longimicrobiales bacterium]|nr:aminotransferase class III-fold pyridoxal phosphate-dependent enzyme [Longimicrobiales bacterium]
MPGPSTCYYSPMIRTQQRPLITEDEAARMVRQRWGLEGAIRPLPGERDRNFLLETGQGAPYVVKVTSPEEPEELLGFETRLLGTLGGSGDPAVPVVVPATDGSAIVRAESAAGGEAWRIRVLEFLPGRMLADVRPRSDDVLAAVGAAVAGLAERLSRHHEPPPERSGFVWALAEAERVIEAGASLHGDPARRRLIDGCLPGLRAVAAALSTLERQLVHGDLNDHNVLVGTEPDGRPRVTGILDFGDAHAAPAVFDLVIATAYAILGAADPVLAVARVAAGYHARRPLSEADLDVLFPLVRARLAASVTISASRRDGGDAVDEYLLVSERPAWETLERTAEVHPRLARAILRSACGLPACPRSPEVVAWLESLDRVEPVMDLPDATTVLDLSVGSPLLTGRDTDDTRAFTRRVAGAMDEAGATVALGRYLEPRGFYLTDAFAGRPSELPERRTVHLGIDVFTAPGAVVRAPLPARVRSVRDNEGRLDYGPTVILEHESPAGPFWTLYGHLERASVEEVEAGAELAAGQPFARVGAFPENGDWPPHLHLQIATDLLDREGDFPGVAAPRELEAWASLSPDPELLLRSGLPSTYRPPEGLAARRARVLSPSLSLSYRRPVHVVRGRGAYLYDERGREYLDGVNNVAHVGHEHPAVVEAGRRQMGVLNTNTRYLHEAVVEYAERLGALLPDPLEVCFFVSSGSEANELALRIARTATGRTGVVALEGGYHGNTQGLIDVSHYKFAGAGGRGAPPWVRAAAMPDDYR